MKIQSHILPLLGREGDEWHHIASKKSSCSTPSSNLASSSIKLNYASHAITKSKCLQ